MGEIICIERSDSGRLMMGDHRSLERKWDVFLRRSADPTPMDPFAAESALAQFAPAAMLDPQTSKPIFVQSYDLTPEDAFHSIGVVTYGPEDSSLIGVGGPDNLPGQDFAPPSFSVHGETINVRQSLETWQGKDDAGNDVTSDYGKLMNVNENGDVNGTDILRRRMRFTIPRYYPFALVTPAWIKSLGSIVGTVCNHRFLSFSTGEVLLAGIDGGPNYDKRRLELTFQFDTSPNVGSVTIGAITLANVLGFSYVWATYQQKANTHNRLVSYPTMAFEEKVYAYADWYILGFGV